VIRLVAYSDRDRALADLGLAAEEATLTPAEKLALGQRSYAAFNAGPDIDALLPFWHPQCEWRMGSMGAAFGTESVRGHDGPSWPQPKSFASSRSCAGLGRP
jgi:hypothetical protein